MSGGGGGATTEEPTAAASGDAMAPAKEPATGARELTASPSLVSAAAAAASSSGAAHSSDPPPPHLPERILARRHVERCGDKRGELYYLQVAEPVEPARR